MTQDPNLYKLCQKAGENTDHMTKVFSKGKGK